MKSRKHRTRARSTRDFQWSSWRGRPEGTSLNMHTTTAIRQRCSFTSYSPPTHTALIQVCSQLQNTWNWPATSRPSYTTRSLVARNSVTTWLAAAKLGLLVPSQLVRREHFYWKACATNSHHHHQFIRQQRAKGHLQVAIYNTQWL